MHCDYCNNKRTALCASCYPPIDVGDSPSNYADDVTDPPASKPIAIKHRQSLLTDKDIETLSLCVQKEVKAIEGFISEQKIESKWHKDHNDLNNAEACDDVINDYKNDIINLMSLILKLQTMS